MQQPTSSPVNTHPPSSQHQCLKDGCMEVFANFGELRKHIRNVHQHSATCMTHSKKQVTIFRSSEGKFGCPNKGCDYTAGPPINIQNHLKLCDPEALNPPRAMPIPPTGSVTVVPLGDQVMAIPDCPHLAYNNYAKTLICVTCHEGIPTSNVHGHMLSSHKLKVAKAEIIDKFLAYGIKLPEDNIKYPPRKNRGSVYPCSRVCCSLCHDELCQDLLQLKHLRTDHIKFFSVLYRQPSPEIICSSHLGSGNEIQAEGSILWDKLSQELSVLDVLGELVGCADSADLYKEIDVSQKSAALVPFVDAWMACRMSKIDDTHFGLCKLAIKES
ncbi:hypothetical protein PGTUg99_002213, partial [Puccinia graminis f. sp. tritici]